MPNRVAIPGGIGVLGMSASVHENLPVAMDVAFKQEIDVGRSLDNFPWIGRVAGHARGEAVGFGIVLGEMFTHLLLAPVRKRNRLARLQSQRNILDEIDVAGPPKAREIGAAIRQPRGWALRRWRTLLRCRRGLSCGWRRGKKPGQHGSGNNSNGTN